MARFASPISIYDRLHFSDAELIEALAKGSARRELTALFGTADYLRLAALAQQAQRQAPRLPTPIYLLPGIMGTQLGAPRTTDAAGAGADTNLLWLDPQDIIAGALQHLALPVESDRETGAVSDQEGALQTMGAIPYSYLALQLRLRAAGFRVLMHDYDWRLDLAALAKTFAARLSVEAAPQVIVIAHSMGGLIARSALKLPGFERVHRLITLGTPHGGSYGAVQALRGTYPVVRRLAALDQLHSAEFLSAEVFSTFPSIYQLLPGARSEGGADVLNIEAWPSSAPRPNPRHLARAADFIATLPPTDDRCIAICGTHQRTITGVRLLDGEFHYDVSDAGDGTVPLASALLPGVSNYFVRCEHSALPRSATVARALLELLRRGQTTRLATHPGRLRGPKVTVSDSELRKTWPVKVDWARLSPAARRDYLNRLNQPPPHYAARRRTLAGP